MQYSGLRLLQKNISCACVTLKQSTNLFKCCKTSLRLGFLSVIMNKIIGCSVKATFSLRWQINRGLHASHIFDHCIAATAKGQRWMHVKRAHDLSHDAGAEASPLFQDSIALTVPNWTAQRRWQNEWWQTREGLLNQTAFGCTWRSSVLSTWTQSDVNDGSASC